MARTLVIRKLTAIVAADVVGWSRLMSEDDTATLATLKRHRSELIDPRIEGYGGRIANTAGDSLLADFPSAVNAVTCCIDVQNAMVDRNASLPANRRMLFRIGVNLGDVIVDGADVFGDGVNVAARLEAMALPGGICIAQVVHDQIVGKLREVFDDAGARAFKNIERPIRVWTWPAAPDTTGGVEAASDDQPEEPPTGRPAIAVLPFDNMSNDADQDYFSDGLTEDIITALTFWRSFRVIARNSCFAYRQRSVDVREVGRALSARYILEGSVRKQGARVRITAQLVDCDTGHHVWAAKFDRDLDDIFRVQDEIVQNIAAVVAPELDKAELERSSAKHAADLDAWDLCLRAKALVRRRLPDDVAAARDLFARAIAVQPDHAEAHAGLAMSCNFEVIIGAAEDDHLTASMAMSAAKRAIGCDGASAWAHHELSTAYQLLGRTEDALDEARIAVRLNPSDAYTLHALGNKADLAGDPEGRSHMQRAQALNPEDARLPMHLTYLARAHLNAGDPRAAIACAREAVRRQPDFAPALYLLALGHGASGEMDEARSALAACDEVSPGFVASRRDWRPYAEAERNRRLLDLLGRIGGDRS